MTIDLHGYHPDDIVGNGVLEKIIQQSWEMGEPHLYLIHGHGRHRGPGPGFVNTNTGYFGLRIRHVLRHGEGLRQWIHHTTLDCGHPGATRVRLKRNPAPSRSALDEDLIHSSRCTSSSDRDTTAIKQSKNPGARRNIS